MAVTDETLVGYSEEARRLWAVALALARAASPVSPRPLPPLLLFTDPARTPEPWTAAARLPAGAAVVFRHFGAPDAERAADRLRQVTASRGVRLLIGLDDALAEAVGADGVHLPERERARAVELRARRPDWLLTAAAHGDLERQPMAGLDALVLSPVFETQSTSMARPMIGVEGLAEAARTARLPIYALGGIDADNAELLIGTGACGLSGVGAFNRAFSEG